MTPRTTTSHRDRRGVVLFAALACLLIVTAIVGSMLQSALRARRQLHTERDCRQAELLLQAGVERAAARLASNLEYRGDIWKLAGDQIVGGGSGRVTTDVSPSEDNRTWQVRVVAEYPLDRDFSVRRSHTFPVTSSTIQSQE